jgi:hypothetical protein
VILTPEIISIKMEDILDIPIQRKKAVKKTPKTPKKPRRAQTKKPEKTLSQSMIIDNPVYDDDKVKEEERDNEKYEHSVENVTKRLWVCTDHHTIFPFNPSSIVVADDEKEAFEVLDRQLSDSGLKTYAQHEYTLQELDLNTSMACILTFGKCQSFSK